MQVVNCEGGFPVQFKLEVTTETDRVVAVRTVRLALGPLTEPNTNPRVDGLAVVTDDGQEVAITEMPEVAIPRARETPIKAVVTIEAANPYTGKDDNLQPVATRERLSFSWFVDSGGLDQRDRTFDARLGPLEDALQNAWSPGRAQDFPGETARLVLVVRDNRGGLTWRTATVRLGGEP